MPFAVEIVTNVNTVNDQNPNEENKQVIGVEIYRKRTIPKKVVDQFAGYCMANKYSR